MACVVGACFASHANHSKCAKKGRKQFKTFIKYKESFTEQRIAKKTRTRTSGQ